MPGIERSLLPHDAKDALITPDDQPWMENLGCEWPSSERQEAWLEAINKQIVFGDQSLVHAKDSLRTDVFAERIAFLRHFAAISPSAIESLDGAKRRLPPCGTLVRIERTYHKHSLDAVAIANKWPLGLTLDASAVGPKIRMMYGAARLWELPNYRAGVRQIINERPQLLATKSARLRALFHIASSCLERPPDDTLSYTEVGHVMTAASARLIEAVVVGYLLGKDKIHEPRDIYLASNPYRTVSKQALVKIILEHSDDPIAKAYLRGYPPPSVTPTTHV